MKRAAISSKSTFNTRCWLIIESSTLESSLWWPIPTSYSFSNKGTSAHPPPSTTYTVTTIFPISPTTQFRNIAKSMANLRREIFSSWTIYLRMSWWRGVAFGSSWGELWGCQWGQGLKVRKCGVLSILLAITHPCWEALGALISLAHRRSVGRWSSFRFSGMILCWMRMGIYGWLKLIPIHAYSCRVNGWSR